MAGATYYVELYYDKPYTFNETNQFLARVIPRGEKPHHFGSDSNPLKDGPYITRGQQYGYRSRERRDEVYDALKVWERTSRRGGGAS